MTKQKNNKDIKICLVTSSGGHFFKTYQLKPWWKKYNRFWVTKKDKLTKNLLKNERKYYGYFPENRNLINAIKNLILAIKILGREKPDLVFSMGAGIAPPFLLIAKLFGIKTIYMETFVYIPKQTLSGKLVYPFVDTYLVQNKLATKKLSKARYWGKTL